MLAHVLASARDADSVQKRVLGLSRRLTRYAAITGLILVGTEGLPNPALLSEYSSDLARQLSLRDTVYRVAVQDREAALQLIDT